MSAPHETAARGKSGLDFRRQPAGPLTTLRGHALQFFNSHGVRELVESVVIAFVLAFLFKTFEAEAFVIPTGSMAPTLQGRHKDYDCPKCGFQFQANASEEVDQATNQVVGSVASATCPNCRYSSSTDFVASVRALQMGFQPFNSDALHLDQALQNYPTLGAAIEAGALQPTHPDEPSYNGDRILVNKFAYDVADPQRWDVVVFRYPLGAVKNYIKRLVGLPGELLEIHQGELYVAPLDDPAGADALRIARKPPSKILAMAQLVYNNNYVVDWMTERGWPVRWSAAADAGAEGWRSEDGARTFAVDGAAAAPQWLLYRHFVPGFLDWEQMLQGPLTEQPRPELITDAYQYNSSSAVQMGRHPGGQVGTSFSPPALNWAGTHWVGDLILSATIDVRSDSGALLLELVEGGVRFSARIDVAIGAAVLSINDGALAFDHGVQQPQGAAPIRGPGSYAVTFANVDDQLALWVDGRVIEFDGFEGGQVTYPPLGNNTPQSGPDDPGDLAPARIGSDGASLAVRDLLLRRDVYYIAASRGNEGMFDFKQGHLTEFGFRGDERRASVIADGTEEFWQRRHTFFSTPELWPVAFQNMRRARFELEQFPDNPRQDQFFALGDNSPSSSDSRLWAGPGSRQTFFERDLLIGKAVFIYWPHSWNKPIPMTPNFERMQFVR